MPSSLPPVSVLRRLFMVGAAGVFATWFYFGRNHDSPALPALAKQAEASMVFGPGKWVTPRPEASPAPSLNAAEATLLLADSGDLIIDAGLLKVLNFYLVENAGTDTWQRLANDLRGRLPDRALGQAIAIAQRYREYLVQYDRLLAAQNLAQAADLGRLRTWAQQRHALRQRLLGDAVALAWYDNDEANLTQAIDELEQRASGQVQEQSLVDPRYAPSAEQTRRQAEAHERHLHEVLLQATRSFASQASRQETS